MVHLAARASAGDGRCSAYVRGVRTLPANAILEFSADGAKTAYTMSARRLTDVCALDRAEVHSIQRKAVWWAQILKAAIGLGLVIAVRLLLKEPLLALCNGHNVAHTIRYFLMSRSAARLAADVQILGSLGKRRKQQNPKVQNNKSLRAIRGDFCLVCLILTSSS
jgi:hypothetical protein